MAKIIIPASRFQSAVRTINKADTASKSAVQALRELAAEFPNAKASEIADGLVEAGCRWSKNTIQQELGRLKKALKAGIDCAEMTAGELRKALEELPKAGRKPRTPKPEIEVELTLDMAAQLLVDAMLKSGVPQGELGTQGLTLIRKAATAKSAKQ